jgi:hypothetical protein
MQTYTIAQWRGTENGYRHLGSNLPEAAAIRRIALAERIWPERARPKAYAQELGRVDTLQVTRKPQ